MSVILFRPDGNNREEYECAKKHFMTVVTQRTDVKGGQVIGRYSVLPYYRELEIDLKSQSGAYLVNSYQQHQWIANFDYYEEFKEYTFETWTDYDFYKASRGPYVVKGRTNSRKHEWNRKMFAFDKKAALEIAGELANDPLIGPQGLIYRKYEPLKTLEVGLNGLPFTNEWRFFFYKGHLVTGGYYWSNAENPPTTIAQKGLGFALKMGKKAAEFANFYVIDIAEKKTGEWVLVEINDGQMSGLSCIDPDTFYKKLGNMPE
jgi:hypothetical protein